MDASPRQSVTFRAPRGRHPTRALTPQTPGGGGREDAILCLCRRGWLREVDKMLTLFDIRSLLEVILIGRLYQLLDTVLRF